MEIKVYGSLANLTAFVLLQIKSELYCIILVCEGFYFVFK